MITLKTHSLEQFNEQYVARRKNMRSVIVRKLLKVLTENAIAKKDVDAPTLANLIGCDGRDIHSRISHMNIVHGVKVTNTTGTTHKSSYRLVGFYEPEIKKRKSKKSKPINIALHLTDNQKLINQVFC